MFGFFKRDRVEREKRDLEEILYVLTSIRKNIRILEDFLFKDYGQYITPYKFGDVTGKSWEYVRTILNSDGRYLKFCMEHYTDLSRIPFVIDTSGAYSTLLQDIIRSRILSSPANEIIEAMSIPGRFDSGINEAYYFVVDRDTGVRYTTSEDSLLIKLPGIGRADKMGSEVGLSHYEQVRITQAIMGIINREKKEALDHSRNELISLYVKD